MRLQHTTTLFAFAGIKRLGLLTSMSQGKMPVVWLHDESRTAWAFLHCVKRHGGIVEDVVSLLVDVPDELVRCTAVPGLYYVPQDVPPGNILAVLRFGVVSSSPLEGR